MQDTLEDISSLTISNCCESQGDSWQKGTAIGKTARMHDINNEDFAGTAEASETSINWKFIACRTQSVEQLARLYSTWPNSELAAVQRRFAIIVTMRIAGIDLSPRVEERYNRLISFQS